jgi:hypothetical protein
MSAKLHFKEPRIGFAKLQSVGTEAARGENTGDAIGKAASPSLVRRIYHTYALLCVVWGTTCLLVLLARAA